MLRFEPDTTDTTPTVVPLVIHAIGVPAPQGSKRAFVVKGKAVMTESSAKVKPWRQDVTAAAQAATHETPGFEPYTGPVAVAVTFYLPRPQTHYRTGRHAGELKPTAPSHSDRKPDVDKLLRSTLDGLTSSGVFRDDAQVAVLVGEKRYADAATGARITIQPATFSATIAASVTVPPCGAGAAQTPDARPVGEATGRRDHNTDGGQF